jgi:hypothetical protein
VWRFRTACAENQITGTVTAPEGVDLAESFVLGYRPADGLLPTTGALIEPDGTYVLPDLPEGDYRLVFVPGSGSGLRMQWSGNATSRSTATDTTVPGVAVVDFQAEAAAAVSGRVTDASGAPLAGVTVFAVGPHDTWVPTEWKITGTDGTYSFPMLPTADYRIAFRRGSDPLLRWWPSGTQDRAAATPVTVDDVDREGIDYRFGT